MTKILIEVEKIEGVEYDHSIFNLNGQAPLEVFKEWEDDKAYRKDLKNVKIYKLIDITEEIKKSI